MVREGMDKIGVPVIGAIYRDDRMHSPERHLGLTPVTEIDQQRPSTRFAKPLRKW